MPAPPDCKPDPDAPLRSEWGTSFGAANDGSVKIGGEMESRLAESTSMKVETAKRRYKRVHTCRAASERRAPSLAAAAQQSADSFVPMRKGD
jgi:hypothetical protein